MFKLLFGLFGLRRRMAKLKWYAGAAIVLLGGFLNTESGRPVLDLLTRIAGTQDTAQVSYDRGGYSQTRSQAPAEEPGIIGRVLNMVTGGSKISQTHDSGGFQPIPQNTYVQPQNTWQQQPGTQNYQNGWRQQPTGPEGVYGTPYALDQTHIANVVVTDINTGQQLALGTVDIGPVLRRIAAGMRESHQNDGSVFQNRQRLLPQREQGYYHEYVVPTPGVRGPGPQRLVIGRQGEIYYTYDHYDSFIRMPE